MEFLESVEVTEEQFESSLRKLESGTADPSWGIAGPESITWEILGERSVFAASIYALSMQNAYPPVAQAAVDFTMKRFSPAQRLRATFAQVYALQFGSLEEVIKTSRRVHKIHSAIRGTMREESSFFQDGVSYCANEEYSLFWVQATLLEASVRIYELLVRPLTGQEKERFYTESVRTSLCFGINPEHRPATWNDFLDWYEEQIQSRLIFADANARSLLGVLQTKSTFFGQQALEVLELFSRGLMHPLVLESYGRFFTESDRSHFQRVIRILRANFTLLPRRLRMSSAYLNAMRRTGFLETPEFVINKTDQLGTVMTDLMFR